MSSPTRSRRARQDGFALIMAILALMLLTMLGLTLAATTTTELQIAANFRWNQQALYNAEAGIDVGRALLARISDPNLVLPAVRAEGWTFDTVTVPVPVSKQPQAIRTRYDHHGNPSRNFENSACDRWGNGAGYGAVLDDGTSAEAPFQNVTTIFGQTLNGAFTLWVRRGLRQTTPPQDEGAGISHDDPSGDTLILTSEGTAPYVGAQAGTTFANLNRAVRVVEATFSMSPGCTQANNQDRQSGFAACQDLPAPLVGP